jgi:hypothetical protein
MLGGFGLMGHISGTLFAFEISEFIFTNQARKRTTLSYDAEPDLDAKGNEIWLRLLE